MKVPVATLLYVHVAGIGSSAGDWMRTVLPQLFLTVLCIVQCVPTNHTGQNITLTASAQPEPIFFRFHRE